MPYSFKDNRGDTWTLDPCFPEVTRVREMVQFDLLQQDCREMVARLCDPVLAVNVIYCILKPQLDAAGINDLDFGRRMIGDPFDAGIVALLRSITALYPTQRRALLNAIIDQVERQAKESWDQAAELLDGDRIEKIVRWAMQQGAAVTVAPPNFFSEPEALPDGKTKARQRPPARGKTAKKKAARRGR